MVRSTIAAQAICLLLVAHSAAAANIPRQTTESFPTIVTTMHSGILGPPHINTQVSSMMSSNSLSVIPIITNTGPPLPSATGSSGPVSSALSSSLASGVFPSGVSSSLGSLSSALAPLSTLLPSATAGATQGTASAGATHGTAPNSAPVTVGISSALGLGAIVGAIFVVNLI